MKRLQTNKELIFMGEDLTRPRMTVEQEKLKAHFPDFSFYASNGRVASVKGYLWTNSRKRYYVKIYLPLKYPYQMPRIELPVGTVDPDCPHTYSGGDLCVMKSEQWSTTFSIAFMAAKAAVWLNKYDLWLKKGKNRWPGNDQHR